MSTTPNGLWTSAISHSIVVEVKTTDAYRIDLNTLADYRKELIRSSRISEDSSSILIVVGRQDTGDLEAQIRGSRHAWDVRLISVDSLLRLLKVKESIDDPATARKIAQILVPREYTRVDGIIDVVFSAAEEDKVIDEEVEETEDDEPPATAGKKFVKFHDECIARIEAFSKGALVKQTSSTYSSSNNDTAVVCSISRPHGERNTPNHWYWFAFHPYYRDFLGSRKQGFVALGCGSPDTLVLIPFQDFNSWLDGMNITNRENGMYWHVKIHETASKLMLHRKPGFGDIDLKKYRI
jgi:hypothetical protein